MLKKKRFILGIFIVLLGLGLSISFLWEDNGSLDEFETQIEHKLSPVFDEFDEDYLNLLMDNRPEDRVTFSSLNIGVDHPFYLFSEQGELLYWSNSEIIPSYGDFNKTRKYQLIENDKGTYLIQLRKLTRNEKGYWMVQMFSLYNKVEIQNEFLRAGYNPAIFGNDRFILSDIPKEGYADINRSNGEYLFSILFRVGYENAGQNTNQTILLFFFSLLGLVIVIGGDFVRTIWRRGRRWVAIAYTVVIMVAVRAMMLGFHFPKAYIQSPLFNSTHYASSLVNPSLGDLLLNTICIMVVLTMILQTIGRNRFLINFIRFKRSYKEWGFLVLGYALSTLLMVAFFNLYVNIVNNSQWDLNIGALPDFDRFKAISLLIIFMGGVAYLLLTLVGLHLILYKSSNSKAFSLKVLVAFFLPIMIYFAFTDFTYLIAVLAHFVLLVAIVTFRLYENLFRLGLNTFLTFFFGCLIGALITGAAAYQDIRKNEIESKRKFANQVLLEEDFMAEFLISDVMEKISEDLFIKRTLTAPLQSKEPIVQKIKRVYLGNYFGQYDINIKVFNKGGINQLNRSETLDDYRFRYMKSDLTTGVRNLYHVKGSESGGESKFYSFVNLYENGAYIGTILMELAPMRIQSSSVFPKLLLDNKYAANLNMKELDYAIFTDGLLQFSVGLFNYRSADMSDLLNQFGLFTVGVFQNDYHHFGVQSEDRVMVVSSPSYPQTFVLANVSLFFVTYLALTLLSVFIYSLMMRMGNFHFNYSSRLQLHLNFAFFFPVVVISIITVGLLNNTYRKDLNDRYFEKGATIRDNLFALLEEQISGEIDQEEFSKELYQLAGNTNTDINLYWPSGRLMATNQPNIFEKKILTRYINPVAYAEIIENQDNYLILNEQVGLLNYKTVYMALRDKQGVIGVIAIPFFESEADLNAFIVTVFSNILNSFVFIFILFLIVSYFVSKRLTSPFKLLTDKLKTTNLENNEPMNWPSNDEIGLLVNEYNNMLFKLEASLKVLANNEKESAWREMAKQVAHEIKNPLTPMKLTLQHLMRLQSEGKLDDPQMLKKPVQTLINQVDVLSDIATSFSAFAKMPLPESKIMDLRMVVLQAVELFQNHERGNVELVDETTGEVPIMGDPKLFGRVISNLIINGIQSVDNEKKAEIKVILFQNGESVQLEIRDNGKGVGEELKQKIFLPNFSTKSEGSGLGLAIAKRGVETAGGKIWFKTKIGQGTSFFLSFPLVKIRGEVPDQV